MRLLGRTFLGPGNLARELAPVLVDSRRKLASKLVKLIYNNRQPLLAFKISVADGVRHISVILLAQRLEIPEVPPARQAMPR